MYLNKKVSFIAQSAQYHLLLEKATTNILLPSYTATIEQHGGYIDERNIKI